MSSFRTIELSDSSFEKDGLRFMTVKTPNLKGRGDICLYIPQWDPEFKDLPIYILLHGVYGSAWIWALKGGAHHCADRLIKEASIKPAILAMPSDGLWGDGSAYFAHHARDYESWIISDVPLAIAENIPQASKRSALCIGGLSMGGYGALRLGASHPDRFTAISAHSSITKLEQMSLFVEEEIDDYQRFVKTPEVKEVIKKNKDRLPALRFDCGREDLLIEPNRTLHKELKDSGIKHAYEEFGGGHEWAYWQEHLEKSLRFFDKHI